MLDSLFYDAPVKVVKRLGGQITSKAAKFSIKRSFFVVLADFAYLGCLDFPS